MRVSEAFEFGPCAGVELGAMVGTASGIEQPKHGTAPWLALGAGVSGRAHFGAGFAAVAAADALAALARARFVIDTDAGRVTVYRASALALRASLAIAYEFP
jgi:hypothetical protein